MTATNVLKAEIEKLIKRVEDLTDSDVLTYEEQCLIDGLNELKQRFLAERETLQEQIDQLLKDDTAYTNKIKTLEGDRNAWKGEAFKRGAELTKLDAKIKKLEDDLKQSKDEYYNEVENNKVNVKLVSELQADNKKLEDLVKTRTLQWDTATDVAQKQTKALAASQEENEKLRKEMKAVVELAAKKNWKLSDKLKEEVRADERSKSLADAQVIIERLVCAGADTDCPIKNCKEKEEKFRCEWSMIWTEDLIEAFKPKDRGMG